MKLNPSIFRAYDIRGVYKTDFDEEFAFKLGQAFGSQFPSKTAVGYDARLSSPSLAEAVREGIRSAGSTAVDLKLVTSPVCYFSTFCNQGIENSIMITGSHNPSAHNGFKFCRGKTSFLSEDILKLKAWIQKASPSPSKGALENLDIISLYVNHYKKEFSSLKNIPAVLDCGNGAGGCVARRLYEAVGLKPTILFEKPDGTFPNHHPDPTIKENMAQLSETIQREGAALGIGLDGDADRIVIFDNKGQIVMGDELIGFCADFILQENPGAKIIGDVKCSDHLYKKIRQAGGHPIMWKTGHTLIKNKVKEEKAPFGGELSGHVFFADKNFGFDDALYAGLRVIERLGKTEKSFREMASFPKSFSTPEIRLETTEENQNKIMNKVIEHFKNYKNANFLDGVRLSFPEGWALCRASNTQPVIVLRFEANSPEALERIQKEINSLVLPYL